jgi:hypothetical protein
MPPPFQIVKGLKVPLGRPPRRGILDDLVALAEEMRVGDAAMLRLSEANQFRIILAAQGWLCLTDGYACPDKRFVYAFKLWKPPIEPVLNYEI